MAGSSGAGKTEVAKRLIAPSILRIDPDELREEFADYDGKNSHLFQGAVTILAEEIHAAALEQGISFIFDGTFSDMERQEKNIARSLEKGRAVSIVYVYQNPVIAWKFVQARAKEEGRTVPKTRFVKTYFGARKTVEAIKAKYGDKINLVLVRKNSIGETTETIPGAASIDKHIPEEYNEETLINWLD
ncbi:MAG: zeta toxin family protein [Gammaproteobacteria bacterium]